MYKKLRRAYDDIVEDSDGEVEIGANDLYKGLRSLDKGVSSSKVKAWMKKRENPSDQLSYNEFLAAFCAATSGAESEESLDDKERHSKLRMKASLNGRFASSNEDAQAIKHWKSILGKKKSKQLDETFEDFCGPDETLKVKHLADAFEAVGDRITNAQLQNWMEEMDLRATDTLSLVDFLYTYHFIFGSKEEERSREKHSKGMEDGKTVGTTLQTVTSLASQMFSNGECSEQSDHSQLIRRLAIGRTEGQAEMLLRMREAFERIDEDESGEIPTTSLSNLLQEVGRNPDSLRKKIETLSSRTARITLCETLAEFGFLVEDSASILSVPSAFAKLRLHCAVQDIRSIVHACLEIGRNILQNPTDARFWKISCGGKSFFNKIGRHKGGKELLQAMGFLETPGRTNDDATMELKGSRSGPTGRGKHASVLSKKVLDALEEKCNDIDLELAALDGAPSVAGAVREMKLYNKTRKCRDAADTALVYVNNILKNLKDARCWRVREANPIYQRRIGCLHGSEQLMRSIGFELESTSHGSAFVLRGTTEAKPSNAAGALTKFKFPKISGETESFLWRRKADLEVVLQDMDDELSKEMGKQSESNRAEDDLNDAMSPLGRTAKPKKTPKTVAHTPGMKVLSVLGKTDIQKLQIHMMKEAFRKYDHAGKGYVTDADVRATLRSVGEDASESKVRAWIRERDLDQDGVVSLDEFVAAYAPLLEHRFLPPGDDDDIDSKNTVAFHIASAVGEMRLLASIVESHNAITGIISILDNMVEHPSVQKYWRISTLDPSFDRRIGRHAAALRILKICGFISEENSTVLALFNPSGKPWSRLPEDVIATIRNTRACLVAHSRALEDPSIGDIGAVSLAIADMYKRSNAKQWVTALETVLVYLNNVVKHPTESKYRFINSTNPAFMKKIGHVTGAVELLVSIGFRENEQGNFALGHDESIPYIAARKLEIETGLKQLKQNLTAKEKSLSSAADKEPRKSPRKVAKNEERVVDKKAESKPSGINDAVKQEHNKEGEDLVLLRRKMAAMEKEKQREAHRAKLLESKVTQLQDKLSSRMTNSQSATVARMPVSQQRDVERMAQQLGIDSTIVTQLTTTTRSSTTFEKQSQARRPPVGKKATGSTAPTQGSSKTVLRNESDPGHRVCQLGASDAIRVGNKITLGEGAVEEQRVVIATNPVVLDPCLSYPHEIGESAVISATKLSAKIIQKLEAKVRIRLWYSVDISPKFPAFYNRGYSGSCRLDGCVNWRSVEGCN